MRRKGDDFIVLTGLDDLDRKLASLPGRIRKKVVRQAMRKAMRLVQKAAKANIRNGKKAEKAAPGAPPVNRTGALKRSIKVRAAKIKGKSVAIVVRTGEGTFKGDTFYGGFLEYGTKDAPPHPFMGPAAESQGPAAKALALAEIASGVGREASKG